MGRSIGNPYLPYKRRMSQRRKGGTWVKLERYLRYNKVSVIQRGIVEVDKDVVVPQLRYLSLFIEAKAIEAILPSDGPLFGCRWCHDRYSTKKLR